MTPIDELLKFIKPDELYPPFLARYRALISDAQSKGAEFYATCGYRSPEQQMTEYLKGRETVGPNATEKKPLGDTVTKARPYESYHQFGIAIDSTRDGDSLKKGLQPSWKRGDYEILATLAPKHGLRSLGPSIGDWPHVEMPLEPRGLALNVLRLTIKSARTPEEGKAQVWELLRRRGVL